MNGGAGSAGDFTPAGHLSRTMEATDGTPRRHVIHDVREQVDGMQAALLEDLQASGFDDASCFAIRLALEEAMVNAFRHGNKSDPAKRVTIEWTVGADRVQLDVEDEGDGFDPESVPDPTAEENLEIPSGRGLMLIRAYMTDVRYNETGNRVSMTFARP